MNLRDFASPIRITRAAEFAPASYDADRGTIQIVWSTGAAVVRQSWDGPFREELDLDGARLGFLNSGRAPFLDSHNSRSVSAVLGIIVADSARIEDGQGVAEVKFSEASEHAGIVANIRSGVIRNVSVGYDIHRVEITPATTDQIETIRAVDWEPLEISAVPIGADADAMTRSLVDATRAPQITTPEGITMSESTAPAAVDTAPTINPDEIRTAAITSERSRISAIRAAAAKLGLRPELADQLVEDGTTIDAARAALIDAAAEADARIHSHITPGAQDAGVTRGQDMVEGLMYRANPGVAQVPKTENGRRYANMTLPELAREGLSWHGIKSDHLSRSAMITEATKVRSGMHTTSDFPLILGEVTGKRLRMAYDEAPATFAPFCRQTTAPDFKLMRPTQLGELPTVPVVNEHGEYRRVTLTEGQETYRIQRYGEIVGITSQMIINDDLSAFSRLPAALGNAVRRMEQDVVWGLITANANMADGAAFFNTADGTLLSSGGVPSIAQISALRQAIRTQTGLDGSTTLNLRGEFILAPVALETEFEQFLSTMLYPAAAANLVPESMRSLRLITDPRLDASSEIIYYMCAGPSQADGIEYAYLAGESGPVYETQAGFDIDGVSLKVREDFGAQVLDRRPFCRNPGV